MQVLNQTSARLDSEYIELTALASRIVRLCWQHRGLLGRACALGFATAVVISFVLPNHYEARTTIVPPDEVSVKATTLAVGASDRYINTSDRSRSSFLSHLISGEDPGTGFLGVLESRTVQQNLVARFDLKKVYGLRYDEDARKKLHARTDIVADPVTGLITIKVTDRDKHRAQAIAAAYIEELGATTAELSATRANRERLFLEEQLEHAKEDLDSAASRLRDFSSKNLMLDVAAQGKAAVITAAELQGQWIAVQAELGAVAAIYSPINARTLELRGRAAELQKQILAVRGTEHEQHNSSTALPSVRGLPSLGATYNDLLTRVKMQEGVFETLSKDYELARIHGAREAPVVRVLDKPVVPERRSFPPRLLIVFLGTMLSFACGAAWIWTSREWAAATSPSAPHKAFAIEVAEAFRRIWGRRLLRRRRRSE